MNIIKGDLLAMAMNGDFDVIVQGCNCFNTMGSGIARQIRERFPLAYEADKKTKMGDRNKLGTYSLATILPNSDFGFIIINAYTQYDFNRMDEKDDVFEYTAFKLILEKLAAEYPKSRIGLPALGCGLAGGNKEIIYGLIEQFANAVEKTGGSVTLVEYEQ